MQEKKKRIETLTVEQMANKLDITRGQAYRLANRMPHLFDVINNRRVTSTETLRLHFPNLMRGK